MVDFARMDILKDDGVWLVSDIIALGEVAAGTTDPKLRKKAIGRIKEIHKTYGGEHPNVDMEGKLALMRLKCGRPQVTRDNERKVAQEAARPRIAVTIV